MQQLKKIMPFIIGYLLCSQTIIAQEKAIPKETIPVFTADSLVSGNTKDILTSFFQLALNNLTGKNKAFNFSANPFAIMLRKNPLLNVDTLYTKNKPLRKLNFDFGLRLDSSYNYNGFSSGLKYSIVDKRDATTSALIFNRLPEEGAADERKKLNKSLGKYASDSLKNDQAKFDKFIETVSVLFNYKVAFNSLDKDFQKVVMDIVKKEKLTKIENLLTTAPSSSLKANDEKVLESLKTLIKTAPLWIVGVSDTTYKDKFQFSNVVLYSEYSKGIFDPQPGANNLEVNIKAAYNFLDDTLKAGRNLKREIFTIEPGINWVIRDKTNDKSFFEVKLSSTYYHNFAALYANEDRSTFTLNITPRVRIYDDIWLPVEIKYNPENGRILGLLDIKANFTGLKKLLKNAAN